MRIAVAVTLALVLGLGAGYFLGAWRRPQEQARLTLDLSVVDNGVYRVRHVVDGDTVVLENGLHVRYHGMDAPETGRWVRDKSVIGPLATTRNIALVEGKRVRLKLAREPLDIHGRVVARLFALPDDPQGEEVDVGVVLVREGLARAMGMGLTSEEYRQMKACEEEARAAKAGMWDPAKIDRLARPYCAADKTAIYHRNTCLFARRIAPASLHQ
ncbi:MAG: thermonuclease family protein, partial [Planctomycetota bacterium]